MEYVSAQINTTNGDSYEISLVPPDTRLISANILQALGRDVSFATIYLERTKGFSTTPLRVLSRIADIIAEAFISHEDMIICYFCDPFSILPVNKKNVPVQEYRSRLFQDLFNRYVRHRGIDDVNLVVVEIPGIDEMNYVHLYVRNCHMKYVSIISEEFRKDYGK